MADWPAILVTEHDPESPITTGLVGNIVDRTLLNYESHFVVKKDGPETVTTSAALQDDDDFHWAVGADEIWCYRMVLVVSQTTNGMFKFNWSVPAGASVAAGYFLYVAGALVTAGFTTFGADLVYSPNFGATDECGAVLEGYIDTAAAAGTATFRWAQNAALGNGTLTTHCILSAHQQRDTI
jgi:hypothetical protein